jgi:hypothetical protein
VVCVGVCVYLSLCLCVSVSVYLSLCLCLCTSVYSYFSRLTVLSESISVFLALLSSGNLFLVDFFGRIAIFSVCAEPTRASVRVGECSRSWPRSHPTTGSERTYSYSLPASSKHTFGQDLHKHGGHWGDGRG